MWYSFINRLKASFGLADVVDILVVAFLVYEAIILVRKTRTAQLAKGILALLLVWAVASFAHLRTLQFILDNLMSWGLIALVIVFQPELRRALEQVGNTNILSAAQGARRHPARRVAQGGAGRVRRGRAVFRHAHRRADGV